MKERKKERKTRENAIGTMGRVYIEDLHYRSSILINQHLYRLPFLGGPLFTLRAIPFIGEQGITRPYDPLRKNMTMTTDPFCKRDYLGVYPSVPCSVICMYVVGVRRRVHSCTSCVCAYLYI